MSSLNRIAQQFVKSKLFSPTGMTFLRVIRGYVEQNRVSLSHLAGEIEMFEQALGIEIDIQQEKHFAEVIIPQILDEVDTRIADGIISEGVIQNFMGYTEILPFRNRRYQACLISVLLDMNPCFELYEMLEGTSRLELPPHLKEYYFAKDDLLDVSEFAALPKGFLLKSKNLVVYPRLPLQVELQILSFFEANQGEASLMIRPRSISSYSSYSNVQRIVLERIFGMPFTEDNLRQVLTKEYGIFSYSFKDDLQRRIAEGWFVPLKQLQYVIRPLDDQHVTLSMEEVMDIDKEHYNQFSRFRFQCGSQFYRLQRYVHAIIHRESLEISHLDCSYMYYDFDAYCERIHAHIKDKVANATMKKKIFRIDGIVPFDNFKKMLAACLEHNPEVVNFVRGS